MLNPRAFLEDTLRCGLDNLWAAGMPWYAISPAIDTDFNYNVSDQTKANWVANTGRNWDNIQDPMTKALKCPACQTPLEIPWTTCGEDESSKSGSDTGPGLVGNGYGDGDLTWACQGCAIAIDKKLLSVAKFARDAQSLIVDDVTMPGTILEPTKGKPAFIPNIPSNVAYCTRTFPNRLIKKKLIVQVAELIKPGMRPTPTMETVRDLIERILVDGAAIREIEGLLRYGRARIFTESRICVRKMMSRYWENFSPFALDLAGAVMRQGIFTAKMVQIDWLHSPACRETMARLITKYGRFIALMREHPNKTCVPTLDVDLAWHTHQLSPSAYYLYTTTHTTKFIDHDDKIDEDKLSEAFEWTTRTYQDKYTEVYSECTCWYCETVRSANTGTVSRILGVSNQEKAAHLFHESGRANLCPPDKSAHISAHNAVRAVGGAEGANPRDTVNQYLRERRQRQLEANYEKACRRAQKKGRSLPPREEYYSHWGYQYYMYSPFMYPLYFTPGLYYGWDPGYGAAGVPGGWASCAAGSCGNGVAAGSCGGPGGCGAIGAGGCGASGGGVGGGKPCFLFPFFSSSPLSLRMQECKISD